MRWPVPIQFSCSCGRTLQAKDEHAGLRVKCPACGAEATVPGAQAAVQTAEPPRPSSSPVQADEPRRGADEDNDRPRRRARADEDDDDDRPRRRARDDDDDEDDRPRRRSRDDDDDEDRSRRDDDDDDYDRPRAPAGTSGKATAALVLGFLSFCLPLVLAIPAFILALLSFGDIRRSRGRLGGKGMAVAGLVLALVGTICSVVIWSLVFMGFGEANDRRVVANNMRQMTISMHNYNDTFGQLPQATPDPKLPGRTKMSWRVELLPFLGYDNVYKALRHDEPWDSPHNKALLTPMPPVFAHPKHPEDNACGLTYYRVFTGEHTPFPLGRRSSIPASFPDGTSNTILIVEAATPVPWTKPEELEYDANKPSPKVGGHFRSTFIVGMADGSARQVDSHVSDVTLRAAITADGGELLGPDW
jgi:hypothetical protein